MKNERHENNAQNYQLWSEYFALFDPLAYASLRGPYVYGYQCPSLYDTLDQFVEKTFQLVGLFHFHQSLQNVSEQLLEKCLFSMP